MNFKSYVESLNALLKDRPETAKYTVVASSDDEGNCYNRVYYSPSVGDYGDSTFEPENVEEDQEVNAVCIN